VADVTLVVHYITSGLGGGGNYLTGQYIRVIADGAAIRAELWDDATAGSFISNPSGGPDLTGEVGQITVSSGSFSGYSYCESTDQVSYTLMDIWPYAEYHLAVNHPSCAIVVCDLELTGFTVTNETAVGASDGQIALTSTGTNGIILYSLIPDFDYATQGLTSPLTGLGTGNYIVYAKDPAGCVDEINVFVGIDYTYAVRWRCDYDHIFPNGFTSRIDIEERDYVGAINETFAGEEPFTLEYPTPPDNSQLTPSSAVIQFLVDRGEEGKFEDIAIGYDRQFVCRKYKDSGSGFVLEWVGYVIQEDYSEPYYHDPYVVSFKAVDGLADLKEKDFIELSGAEYFGNLSIIKVISECLKKLPVQLNIRSCVNIFEEGMATSATDDPLAQVFTKAENYRGFKCGDVITDLIKPFTKAELFQSYGVWWMRTKEQSVYTTLAYREFDKDGVFLTNDTILSRKNAAFPSTSNRFCWIEQSQRKARSRNYGKFTVTHDLGKDNNMIDSGGFEENDIDPSTEFFRDWQFYPAQTNMIAGLEYVDNENTKGAFVAQWAPNGTDQADSELATKEFDWNITGNVFEQKGTHFKLSFKVYASPSFKVDWIRLGWRFRFTDTDTGDFYDWSPPPGPLSPFPTANEALINDIYLTSFNSFQQYEFFNFRAPGDIDAINFKIRASLFMHNHKGRDYTNWTTFKAVPTTGLPTGKRFYVAESGSGAGDTYGMELQRTSEAESIPNVVEPDDYNGTSNPFKWVKIAQYNQDGSIAMLDRIMIDDFKISMFEIQPVLSDRPGTGLLDPAESAIYEQEIATQNESVYSDTVKNGDAPNIMGADYIYNGILKLSDGTLTQRWARTGITESRYLLDIYLGHLAAQGSQSLRLLSGSGIADIQLGYINSLEDQIDDRRYRFKRFLLADKAGRYDVELEEVLTGADGESPPDFPIVTFDSTFYKFDNSSITFDEA
jgi:hypothetical protein